tara:strand:+ start:223 stop:597 length:375 start_codon:yes stop_codon:yes gene_type:complete
MNDVRVSQVGEDKVHFVFSNNIILSIGFGNFHSCDAKKFGDGRGTTNMEVCIINQNPRPEETPFGREYLLPERMKGYVPVSLLPDVMTLVAIIPSNATKEKHGQDLSDTLDILISKEEKSNERN